MKNAINRAFAAKKNYSKYICLFLMLLGTCAHAWGVTVSKTTPWTTSGSFDSNISWNTYKGAGTNNPAITSDNKLRLYRNSSNQGGGLLNITASNGCTITSITITFSSGLCGYRLSSATYNGKKSDYTSCSSGSAIAFDNVTAVQFANIDENNQLDVVTVSVTYTPACTSYDITLSGYPAGTLTGGTISSSVASACEDVSVSLTATPSSGYTFSSWTITKTSNGNNVTASVLAGNTLTMPDYAVTVNATFAPQTYTVTLNPNGGSGGNQTVTATYNAAMPTTLSGGGAIVLPTKTGYTFDGWVKNNNGTGTKYYTSSATSNHTWDIANNTTIYAKWSANTTTITLNKNCASGSDGTASITYDATSLTSKTDASNNNASYHLEGYYTNDVTPVKVLNADGTYANTNISGYVTSGKWSYTTAATLTLYAHWAEQRTLAVANVSHVTISATTPSVAEGASALVTPGATVTLTHNTPTSPYSWAGWHVYKTGDENTTVVVNGSNQFEMPDYDVTVNAYLFGDLRAFCEPEADIKIVNQTNTGAADIHLTSTNGVTVYATNACGNLIRVICEHLDAIADLGGGTSNKQNIQIKYLDANNGDAEVAKTSSPFRLCNNGSSDYNMVDPESSNIRSGVEGETDFDQTYSISYTPREYGVIDHYKLQLRLQNNNTEAKTITLDLYGRSLPKEFVIAAKYADDNKWYALPNNLLTTSSQPSIVPTDINSLVDNTTTPTKVTNPMNTVVYGATDRFKNSPNTQFASIRFTSDGNNHLQAATGASTYNMWLPTGNDVAQNFYLKSSNFEAYEVKLDPANSITKKMGFYASSGIKMGLHGTAPKGAAIYFLPIEYTDMEADIMEWGTDHLVMDLRDAGTATTVKTQIELGSLSSAQTLTTVKKDAGVYLLSQTLSTSDAAKEIKLLFYDGSDALIGSSKFTIPLLVSASDATTSGFSITKANAETCDLVVLNGAKLTIESSEEDQYTFKDLYVYGGGKMVVPTGKYITFDNVYLRGGHLDEDWNYVYSHPQLVLNGTMSNASNLICYDYLTNNAQFYSLALPYDVTLTDIVNPSFSNKRSWQIHGYDGAKRASGSQVEGWYDVEDGTANISPLTSSDHLTAGIGYTFWGAMQKVGGVRQKWSVNRFKMTLASGSPEAAKAGVSVTAHGMTDGELNEGVAPNDACWNMLGNPYLADLGGTSAFEGGELVQGKILSYHNVKIMDDNDNWTGAWEWQANESTVRYVRIPNNAGTEYTQVRFKDATLKAFHHFFIQAGASGTFSFDISMRANAAPARFKQSLLPEEMDVDLTIGHDGATPMAFGLTLNDEFSDGFAIGEDIYEELEGSNMKAYTFTPVGASRVTFNGIPFASAQKLISVGYRAPEAGEYTFSYKEDANSVHLEHVWLTDKTLSTVSDLKDAPYVFTTEAGVNDERFALNLVYSDNVITDVEGVNDDSGKPQKFIHQGKMFILRNGVIYDATSKRVREVNK